MKQTALLFGLLIWGVNSTQAALIDFEVGTNLAPIPENTYEIEGVRIVGGLTFEVGQSGFDSVHSGTRGLVVGNTVSMDGTSVVDIVTDHGLTAGFQPWNVGDIVFVEPGTSTQATANDFSLWMGFDAASSPFGGNHIVIEAFNLLDELIIDYTSISLVGIPEVFESFAAPVGEKIARLRVTQVGGVGIDDFSFTTSAPVPTPAAVWLFGSAFGLLGWMRHKAT